MEGILHIDGWHGRIDQSVIIVGETKWHYKVRATMPLKLPRKWVQVGEQVYVPKHAVTVKI